MSKEASIKVWIGNWGTYAIPKHLQSTPMTKSGWPDARYRKRYRDFMYWVKTQELEQEYDQTLDKWRTK